MIESPKGQILPLDAKISKICRRCNQPFMGYRAQFYCDYCRKKVNK